MSRGIQKIKESWQNDPTKGIVGAENKNINFNDFAQNIVSVGPFYYYVIDFETMQLSHVKDSIGDILGFDPATVTFEEIFNLFHPNDIDFIAKAEAFGGMFFHKNIKPEKLLNYKTSFNFRILMKDGNYGLFNHQAIMLKVGKDGGYGKCLNIHTHIDHLTDRNNYRYSIISLTGEPSYLNMKIDIDDDKPVKFSKKEIEILKFIADGYESKAIADKMFISDFTVKKHRANILKKSEYKNMTELIKNSSIQGLI